MDLIAQVDSPAVQSGVTMVTVMMCLVQGIFTYLTNKDRLAFDLERNNLSHAVKELEMRADECAKDRAHIQQELDAERADRESKYQEMERQLTDLLRARPQ